MKPSRRALLVSLAAAPFAVSAFGSAMAQGTAPIRIGYVPVIGAASIFVLDQAGWSKEAGLTIRLTKFDSGPAAIQALASGTLDMLAIGVAPVAVAKSKGLDVKIVSAAGLGGSALIGTPAFAASIDKFGQTSAALKDFKQRVGRPAKIATLPPGGVPTVGLHHWLRRTVKAEAGDYELAALGIEAVQQAILSGAVDAGTVLEPSATIVQDRNPALRRIATSPEMFPDIPGVVIAATGAFERAQPDALQTIVKLVVRATDLIKSNPDAAAPYVQSVLGGGLVETSIMAKALRSNAIGFVTNPDDIAVATRALLAFQVELGDFPVAPDTNELFDSSYWKKAR